MEDALRTAGRRAMHSLFFFIPEERRIAIERRIRGRLEHRRLREADVVLVSWAKSGRTWLRLMLSHFYQIRYGLPPTAMLGFANLKRRNLAIPSVFFTHGNYLRDYTGHYEDNSDFDGKRILLLVRDPRDIAVSQYFQWRYRMRPDKKRLNGYPPHGAEVSLFDFVLNADAGLPRIIRFLNLWARERPNRSEVLVVRYEQMRAEPERTLRDILDFMRTPAESEMVSRTVAYASYENMQKLEREQVFRLSGRRLLPGNQANPDSYKTRRAKVGGYRDYFNDAQLRSIDRYVGTHLLPDFGYVAESVIPHASHGPTPHAAEPLP